MPANLTKEKNLKRQIIKKFVDYDFRFKKNYPRDL